MAALRHCQHGNQRKSAIFRIFLACASRPLWQHLIIPCKTLVFLQFSGCAGHSLEGQFDRQYRQKKASENTRIQYSRCLV